MIALTNVTRCLRRLKFRSIKHAPEIFMYAGIAGTVVATTMACKKTEALPKILDEHKEKVEKLKEAASETPINEYRREMTNIYAGTIIKIGRNYAMPAAIFVMSTASIMHGHNVLKKRYIETSALLASTTKDYNNLYNNLVAEVGEERAKEIQAGIISEDVEETITDAKGKDKTIKKQVKRLGPNGSMFTLKWNQETADEWVNDFEMNYHQVELRAKLMESNLECTRETQHLFWVEAVEFMFGTKGLKLILEDRKRRGLPTPLLAGWVYDPNRSKQININYIRDPEDPSSILVTLIPDGNIMELGVGKKGIEVAS